MYFGLLGPALVEHNGSSVTINSAIHRTVLTALLLQADTPVSTDELIEVVWGEDAPTSAKASLHNHLMRLRRVLGEEAGARIRSSARSYQIHVEPGELDAQLFDKKYAAGTRALRDWQWARAAAELADALALWRGEPAGDTLGLGGHPRVRRLLETRIQAYEGRIEADLELGRHRDVIGELRTLTADHPLRETLHGQLMRALYRADRQAEALDVFQRLRRALITGPGTEPSAPLQRLHGQILSADPELAAPGTNVGAGVGVSSGAPLPPAAAARSRLPADTSVFTGRVSELEELIELARTAPKGTDAGMVVISAIDGMGGIGKTTLAVHAAHQVRAKFPDGQLFLDLHGYSPGLEPLSAGDALDWFLRALGVPPRSIPENLGERAKFYRDRLEGTRTLIILDNAAGGAQIRPLLPGGPGCLVLVTSRKRLTGLDDAHSVTLGTMPEADATALLHKVAGPDRIPAHHPATGELIALCGHMPLAIRIVAARLRRHPTLRIEALAAQLRDETIRLEYLRDEQDENRNLTAVFGSSYTSLAPAEQHLFRSLGLLPGPDFDVYAAANLTETDHRTAERLLESLLDHNLLIEHTPGRYRLHDLVRVYAHTLTAEDPEQDRTRAIDRALDYYQHTAQKADRLIARSVNPHQPPPVAEPAAAPDLPDQAAALAWLRAERENLLSAVDYAATHNQPARTIARTAALATFLHQEGPWRQAVTLHRAAAATAHDQGDRAGEANAIHALGRSVRLTGDYPTACSLFDRALTIYEDLGSELGKANTSWDQGCVKSTTGDYPTATALFERGREIYQTLAEPHGEAACTFELGRIRHATGDIPAATALFESALKLYQTLGDRLGEADAYQELGRAHYMAGNWQAAKTILERVLKLFQDLGNRLGEANTLWDLGRVSSLALDFPTAATMHESALAIYQDLGNRLGEANTLRSLGRVRERTADYPAAVTLIERSLTLFQTIGNRLGEASALWDLGRVCLGTGEYPAAIALMEKALALFQAVGHRHGEASVYQDLARTYQATGDYLTAADLFTQTLTIFRNLNSRQAEVETLNYIADLAAEAAGPEEALLRYQEALDLAHELHSDMDEAKALEGIANCQVRTGNRTQALASLREALSIYQRIEATTQAAAVTSLLAELEAATGAQNEPGTLPTAK